MKAAKAKKKSPQSLNLDALKALGVDSTTTRQIRRAAITVLRRSRELETSKDTIGLMVANIARKLKPGNYRVRIDGVTAGVRVHEDRRAAPSVSFVRIPRNSQLIKLD